MIHQHPLRHTAAHSAWSGEFSIGQLKSRCRSLVTFACIITGLLNSSQSCSGQDTSSPVLPSRQTFVPASELDVLIANDAEGVLLSAEEFHRLYAAAQKAVSDTPATPAPVVVSSAAYRATIDGDHLLIEATIHFEQFASEWQTLPLLMHGLSVEQALVNGAPASLARTVSVAPAQQPANARSAMPQQTPAVKARAGKPGIPPEPALLLFHNQPGPSVLKATLSARLTANGSNLAAAIRLPDAPSAVLSVTAPPDRHVRINGRRFERPAPINQPAVYTLPIGGSPELNLLFTEQQGQRNADSLTFAATEYSISVAPGEVTWKAATSLQIYGSQIDQLVCRVPSRLEITDVTSNGLESWELTDSPDDSEAIRITLNYRQPFDGRRDITFHGVTAAGVGTPWSVPALTIESITSHSGRIAVTHEPGMRLRLVSSEGVRPSPGQSANQVFDAWRENFRLAFETQTRRRELGAVVTARLDLSDRQVTFGATLVLTTRMEPLFDAAFRLPAEWVLDQLHLNGKATDWLMHSREAGWNDYSVRLAEPLLPQQSLNVEFLCHLEPEEWPVEEDDVEIVLPNVGIPEATTVEGTLVITAPPDLTVRVLDPYALDPAGTKAATERLRYFFQQADYAGALLVSRTPSLLSATTSAFVRLDQETLHSHLEADLIIEGGGLRELTVGLSESAGEELEFMAWLSDARGQQLAPLQIVEQFAGTAVAGIRPWTLKLDRRVSGPVTITVDIAAPRGDGEEIELHRLTIPAAERVNGTVALEGAPDQQLQLTALDAGAQPLLAVDPIDVPQPRGYLPQERIVAAVRYTRPGYSLSLRETRFDRGAVPTAVCYKSSIQSVIGQTGEWQLRADFEFVAIGAQHLKIELPALSEAHPSLPARLWAVLIDGAPMEVRSAGNSFLVPIPRTDQPDARRRLTLIYQSDDKPLTASGRLEQSPPSVSVIHSSGTEQRMEVLEQSWQVHYPDSVLVTDSPGTFVPTEPLEVTSLLGNLHARLTHINRRSLQQNGLVAFFILAVTGVIAVALRRAANQGRLGLAGCGIAVAAGLVCVVLMSVLTVESDNARNFATDSGLSSLEKSDRAAVSAIAEPASPPGFGGPRGEESAMGDADFDTPALPQQAPTQVLRELGQSIAQGNAPQARTAMPALVDESLTAAAPQQAHDGPQSEFAPESLKTEDAKQVQQAVVDAELSPAESPPAVRGRFGRSMEGGALLSLSLDLEVPDDTHTIRLKYNGTRSSTEGVRLLLKWQHRQTVQVARIFLMLAVALTLWLMLGAHVRTRLITAILCITIPLGLIAILPYSVHYILDGIFLGGLLAIGLWTGRSLLRGLRRLKLTTPVTLPTRPSSQTLAGLLLLAMTATGAHAADPPAAPLVGNTPKQDSSPVPTPGTDVIIPFDPAQDPARADRVLLTREQFLDLWNLANPDQRVLAPAPREGVLAATFYRCVPRLEAADSSRISVAATLILVSFRDQPVTLPLPLTGIALNSAQRDGQPAVLRATRQNGVYQVILPDRGTHTLDLEFDVAAQVSGESGQFVLPVCPSPSGRVVFELPDSGLAVRVNGSSSAYRRIPTTDDQAESIVVPVGNGQPLTIAWRPPQQQGMVDAIVHVDASTTVQVDDRGIYETSRLAISVPQGSIADLSFVLPRSLKVQSLDGPQLTGWESLEVDGERRLRIFFNPPINGQSEFTARLFYAEPVTETESTISLPTIRPLNVTRDSGTIVVSATDSFSLRSGNTEGLRQIELTQTGNARAGRAPQQLAWRYATRPFSLQFILARRQAESTARVEHAIVIQSRKVQLGTKMIASLRGTPRSAISFEVTDSYVPLQVQATALADWYVTESDGVTPRSLTVEFTEPQLGDVEIIVTGRTAKDPRDLIVEAIPPFPLDMTRRSMWAGVWVDDAYSATASDLIGWQSADPRQLPADIRSKQPRAVQFAFQSTDESAGLISFEVVRAQPDLSADAVVVTTVDDTFVDYSLALQWTIDSAATDHVYFTTPASFENRLRVEGASIRTVSSEPNGETLRWTVQLNDAVRGRYFALATATLPPPDSTVTTPVVQFEKPVFDEFGDAVGFEPVEQQRLYAILVNQSRGQLTGSHDSTVESISVDDLPIQIGTQLTDQAAEILRIRDHTQPPAWTVRRYQQTTGAAASVNVADLTLVIHRDGTWRSQATYTVRNLRRQFLGVRLPVNSRLLSLFVRNQPSRPVLTELNGQQVHLVPLPKTSTSDVSFPVTLVFTGHFDQQLPAGFSLQRNELDLPAAHIVSPNESPEFGVPVARTLWNVWMPRDVDALLIDDGERTNVRVATRSDTAEAYLKSQLTDLATLLSVATSSEYSRRSQNVAATNLKQLGLAVHNYREGLQSQEVREQLAQVQQQLADNQPRIDELADRDSQRFAGDGNPSERGRKQVNYNNRALLLGNSHFDDQSLSEDTNRNGLLDPGEDLNGNGVLDSIDASQLGISVPPIQDRRSSGETAEHDRESFLEYQLSLDAAGASGKAAAPQPSRTRQFKDAPGKGSEPATVARESRLEQRQQSVSNLSRLNNLFDQQQVGGGERQSPDAMSGRPDSRSDSVSGGLGGGGGGIGAFGMPEASAVNAGLQSEMADKGGRAADGAFAMPPVDGWTEIGGLSLPVDIPVSGYQLTFSKVSGQPKLALRVQSRDLIDRSIGFVWSLVWLLMAAALVVSCRRLQPGQWLSPVIVWTAFVMGLLAFLLLPRPLSGLGLVAFTIAWLISMFRYVRVRRRA